MPEDRRAPRGGPIQLMVTLVFKTFDLGQVNMHSILHLFKEKKKALYECSGNVVLTFAGHAAEGMSSPHTQVSTTPVYTCRQSCPHARNSSPKHLQHKAVCAERGGGRHHSTSAPEETPQQHRFQSLFFKCLEVTSSDNHSFSSSDVPEETKAAGNSSVQLVTSPQPQHSAKRCLLK